MKVRYETASDTVAVRRVTLTGFACFPRKTTSDANTSPIFRTWRLRDRRSEGLEALLSEHSAIPQLADQLPPINDVERWSTIYSRLHFSTGDLHPVQEDCGNSARAPRRWPGQVGRNSATAGRRLSRVLWGWVQ
jgi:hypothetical protein